jgi:SAM-dependent methyltransferase
MGELFDVRAVFGPDYLRFYGPLLTEERSALEAETVWRLAKLEPGCAVLDAPCGHGRIANRVAAMGAVVTGLDITPAFLDTARQDAERRDVKVDYVQAISASLDLPTASTPRSTGSPRSDTGTTTLAEPCWRAMPARFDRAGRCCSSCETETG